MKKVPSISIDCEDNIFWGGAVTPRELAGGDGGVREKSAGMAYQQQQQQQPQSQIPELYTVVEWLEKQPADNIHSEGFQNTMVRIIGHFLVDNYKNNTPWNHILTKRTQTHNDAAKCRPPLLPPPFAPPVVA